MYISRVEIDVNNRRKARRLSHLGAYHYWVEESFPDEIKGHSRTRKLWRIDSLGGKPYLLIVSENQPDLKLLETFGVEGTAESKLYDPFLNSLTLNKPYRFRVTLNPVVSVRNPEGKRGTIMPHITVAQQTKFLLDRAEKNGFRVDEDHLMIVERAFVPYKQKEKKTIDVSKVTYEGLLMITDLDVFRKTLTEGFGKKKAYGCGLLTVIPVDLQ